MNDQQKAILVLKGLKIKALSKTHFTSKAMDCIKTIAAGKDTDSKAIENVQYFLTHTANLLIRPVKDHEEWYGEEIKIDLN